MSEYTDTELKAMLKGWRPPDATIQNCDSFNIMKAAVTIAEDGHKLTTHQIAEIIARVAVWPEVEIIRQQAEKDVLRLTNANLKISFHLLNLRALFEKITAVPQECGKTFENQSFEMEQLARRGLETFREDKPNE